MAKPRFFVVGLPKSGTNTLNDALTHAGFTAAHWIYEGKPIGQLIYDGWFNHDDPLYFFEGVDAITQMDFCYNDINGEDKRRRFNETLNYWPNLDFGLLLRIQALYPDAKFILNYRDPEKTADSIRRWYSMAARMTSQSINGLPIGRGKTAKELIKFIENHHFAVRRFFEGDPNFLEIDIASETAQDDFEKFVGAKMPWWGVANKNEKKPARSHAT